jgi:dGTP triphosphohydrolase
MDLADDIAYSTYDLEDCLKAGFLTPADILSSRNELLLRVATKVSKKTNTSVSARDVLYRPELMLTRHRNCIESASLVADVVVWGGGTHNACFGDP